MVRLEKLLHLFDCNTPEAWSATLFAIARDYGFSHTLFGIVPSKTVPFETAFLKSNYPGEWRATYDNLQLHSVDPTVSHCLGSMLPIAWKADTFKGREQNEFYEQACGYGLRSGISYPVYGSSGEFGILSFATHYFEHDANSKCFDALATLSLIRDYVFESSKKFLQNAYPPPAHIKLTPRELECLQWVMGGKSSWEISRILRCSEATINFHVSNFKKKFNVQTRQQAVVRAIKVGLIIPS
ncbi:LuxR family transcriptional regulator [Herminiimonas sp. CN]|uniref:helix-turn-helix transcriptional regulator n=1 Tax=Herminiimonas sp. CN TaxID=1349818 RepID=UPI0009DD837B|nr:LuxR family transcriptional regulator [Herminiimonas sp. CN]